jgi:MoaA/NifB/PqqE/SkfB family radical SAM enzyme
MRGNALEPKNLNKIKKIAASILQLKPLAVVITGGEPLASRYFEDILEMVSGKAGVIVDTSGYGFQKRHIPLLKKHNVNLRISLDSELPKINDIQRPLHKKSKPVDLEGNRSIDVGLNALLSCADAKVPFSVHTVATRKSANDLVEFGDKLFRLGVKSWRIFKVLEPNIVKAGYRAIAIGEGNGPYDYNFKKVMESHSARWKKQMAVQVISSGVTNSIILVSPDGKFYTESTVEKKKVEIDEENPYKPRMSSLPSIVNMSAHLERYLNISIRPIKRKKNT